MIRSATILLVSALVLAGCGGDDDDGTGTPAPSATAVAAAAPDVTVASDPTVAPTPDQPSDARGRLADAGAPSIEVAITEPGPHPVLVWDAVPGAAEYWLVVLDADGDAYWSWSGEGTTVRFGGGDSPELNQTAVLFEPMTATVAAIADGAIIGMSEATLLAPGER